MKNKLIQPLLAIVGIIPLTIALTITKFLFAFASLPFEHVSTNAPYTVFVILQIALIVGLVWLVQRQKLPAYFLLTILISIFLSASFGPMD